MNESVVIGKDVDAKRGFSSARRNNKSIQLVRDESERQLGSLGGVIGNIRRNGAAPSAESIATELGSRSAAQRAPALLALQQTHGNRYVRRVVSGIQAKLKIGQPGDKYEQEADRVADAVMRMPEPQVQRQVEEEDEEELIQTKPLAEQITLRVQRPVEEEGEEELQAKELFGQTSEISPNLESRVNTIRGGGQPLPASTRTFFEPRFGFDISQVRIHTDAHAAEIARAVNARSFTVGRDVVFGAGEYAPETPIGKKLLAHELTHVVQQSKENLSRPGDNVVVQRVDNEEEGEAIAPSPGAMEFEEREVVPRRSIEEIRAEYNGYKWNVGREAFERSQMQFNDVIDATRQFRAFCMRRIRGRQAAINGSELFFAAVSAITSSIPGSGVAVALAKEIYRTQLRPPSSANTLTDFVGALSAEVTTETNNVVHRIRNNIRTDHRWDTIIYDVWSSAPEDEPSDACDALGIRERSDFRALLLESLINRFFDLEVEVHPNRAFIRSTGVLLYGEPMGGYRRTAREIAGRTYSGR